MLWSDWLPIYHKQTVASCASNMTDTLYHERQFSTDYLFSLNHYYNQRSSRLPLAGQHNHMEDFTPLAQRCSQSLEKKMFLGRKVNMWQRFIFPHEFQSKDLEKLFQMYAYPFCFDGLRCLLILMIALTVRHYIIYLCKSLTFCYLQIRSHCQSWILSLFLDSHWKILLIPHSACPSWWFLSAFTRDSWRKGSCQSSRSW